MPTASPPPRTAGPLVSQGPEGHRQGARALFPAPFSKRSHHLESYSWPRDPNHTPFCQPAPTFYCVHDAFA